MPYSTGSEDSGVGLRFEYSSHCFDLSATTSSLTCSEEDEYHYVRERPLQQKAPRSSPKGGKGRKYRKKAGKLVVSAPRPASTPNSIGSSTCSSEDIPEEAFFGCSDVVQLYIYFQQLLMSIKEQQKCFQDMAKIVGDIDARWGAHGYKKEWKIDPTGSLAPSPCGETSRFHEGFWAFPHPAVYLALIANYIQEYLHFLRW